MWNIPGKTVREVAPKQWERTIVSTSPHVDQGTTLSPGDDVLYEVVDDQIVELAPMGAYEVWLATLLVARLATFARQHQLGRAVQEMLFDLTVATGRKRRPQVAFVSFDRWPRHRRIPRTEAWEVVPNLAIEIVSRTDSVDQIVDKIAEYFHAGVERVWVVFPSQEQVYAYESPTSVRILTRTDELSGEPILPHFRLPLTETLLGPHRARAVSRPLRRG
jgi:Uma2 family endonuclease